MRENSDRKRCISEKRLLEVINKAKENKVRKLDLCRIGIKCIPKEIGELDELEILDLSDVGIGLNDEHNEFQSLPEEICNLKNLKILDLSGCNIKELPKGFSKLENLRVLYMNGCKFEEFPKEICNLKNLRILTIRSSFKILPKEIGNLVELRALFMPSVPISKLPEEIGNLKKLKNLYLSGTKIKAIPRTLGELKNLIYFSIDSTPLSEKIPPEILKQNSAEVIDYIIHYLYYSDKQKVNESKMIIVGQGGVGKTCLLNRIVNKTYNDDSKSTEGIDIEEFKFKVKENDYKLNIWDFGGQEIYHATHQFFLTKRSLYIFVWDSRQEEEYGRIDYWLNTITSFVADSPIIMVVNKCDKDRTSLRRIDIEYYKSMFPQLKSCFEVSCKDNIGIDNLRKEIISEACKLPLMENDWFKKWIEVRKELEERSKREYYIGFDKYLDICNKYKLEETESLSLIKYLHDLGVVLYFHDDMLLKNIVILKPEWGTEAVYKVLDAQTGVLKERNGIMYDRDLSLIWNDSNVYNEKVYPYIIQLMNRFQLSFEIESNKTFLVVELLQNTEEKVNLEFDRKSTLNYRYQYEFLPAGIMTRFIVKINQYLVEKNNKKMCWKRGAYIKYKDAYSLVRMYDGITERHVDIMVSGSNNRNKVELMSIIRSTFESVHSNIPNLKFKEEVLCCCSDKKCSYYHDYNFLIRAENKGIKTVRCNNSLDDVQISELLDGIEHNESSEVNRMSIEINPTIEVKPTITVENNTSISTKITVEIINNINELQGTLRELKEEVNDNTVKEEIEDIQKKIEKVNSNTSKEEVVKSGCLNKLRRFLNRINKPDSTINGIIKATSDGIEIVEEIAEKYNEIAGWFGLPSVPEILL